MPAEETAFENMRNPIILGVLCKCSSQWFLRDQVILPKGKRKERKSIPEMREARLGTSGRVQQRDLVGDHSTLFSLKVADMLRWLARDRQSIITAGG